LSKTGIKIILKNLQCSVYNNVVFQRILFILNN